MRLPDKHFALLPLFFISVFIIFFLLQQKGVYQKTLGRVSTNWVYDGEGKRHREAVPFHSLENDRLVHWDAKHYEILKDHGYSIKDAGSDYIFAFFPAFPALWRLSRLPAKGVVFLNIILFLSGVLLVMKLLPDLDSNRLLLLPAIPGLVIFMLPYTEALYFFTAALGLLGLFKRKYWLFFLGFFLASLTRPSFSILLCSILVAEMYFFIQHRSFRVLGIEILKKSAPLILGTLTVGLIQSRFEGGEMFTFIRVQEYWGNVLQWPTKLGDWSQEGFGINMALLAFLALPILVYLAYSTLRSFKPQPTRNRETPTTGNYIQILSMIYVIGNVMFILLFRGGSLHCLFRFTIDNPFFVVFLLGFTQHTKIPGLARIAWWALTFIGMLMVLNSVTYSQEWNHSDLGFFITAALILAWLVQDLVPKAVFRIGVSGLIALNVVWTAYLFNMFLSNGWIFA